MAPYRCHLIDARSPTLVVFAMLEAGVPEVHLMDSVVIGLEDSDPLDTISTMRRVHGVEYSRRFTYGPHGGRNVHQMSGRVE